MKMKLLESKIITILRVGIYSCACETHNSQQNDRSCLPKCRTFLSQQGVNTAEDEVNDSHVLSTGRGHDTAEVLKKVLPDHRKRRPATKQC
jgi:hypothetical protein